MNRRLIILCDRGGEKLGRYIPKEIGHQGRGKKHLAITVLIFNSQGQVLLQRRKHKRFDNLWDLTGATDLYHLGEDQDETFKEATLRCLKREYEIASNQVRDLRKMGGFNYFAQDNSHSENEYCAILIGRYDGEINMNPEVGYEYRWVGKSEFLQDVQENPTKYTPWAVKGVKLLNAQSFG